MLLHLVHVDYVLVGWTALGEGIKLVHLTDVLPQVLELSGDLVVDKELASHSDVLQLGHQLGVEATQGVARQEPGALAGQLLVNGLGKVWS